MIISTELMLTMAGYVAVVALLSAAALFSYNQITSNGKVAVEIYRDKMQCAELVFISSAAEETNFQATNSSCTALDSGVFQGDKRAA